METLTVSFTNYELPMMDAERFCSGLRIGDLRLKGGKNNYYKLRISNGKWQTGRRGITCAYLPFGNGGLGSPGFCGTQREHGRAPLQIPIARIAVSRDPCDASGCPSAAKVEIQ
jgi:hypothetical protein